MKATISAPVLSLLVLVTASPAEERHPQRWNYARAYLGNEAGLRKLLDMQIKGWEDSEWPNATFSPKAVYEVSYPREDVLRMEKLLGQAFKQAEGDELVTRRIEYYAKPMQAFFAESKQYVEGTGIKPLNVYQTADDPAIDGKLDEECWKGIEPVPFVRAYDRKQAEPTYPTSLMAVWSRRGVTFGFHMAEPTPDKLKRDIGPDSRDASLMWWNDNVEIFLDVTGQRTGYYQFIVNANGALYDGKGKDTSWNAEGVRGASFIGKDYWTLEVFIPFEAFDDALPPGTGVTWYGNFTRHRVIDRKAREYQRLNTTYAAPSNDQNAFGPVRFIER